MLIRGWWTASGAEELARESTAPSPSAQVEPPWRPLVRGVLRGVPTWTRPIRLRELRGWMNPAGAAVDIPRLAFDMFQIFEAVADAIGGYLGERPAISVRSAPFARLRPSVAGAWHRGRRLHGDVRSLNVWLSLSRCGDEAPRARSRPGGWTRSRSHRRLTRSCSTTTFSQATRARRWRSRHRATDFEWGDALLFDDLFLHRTASDPSMPKPRFAVELVLRSVRVPRSRWSTGLLTEGRRCGAPIVRHLPETRGTPRSPSESWLCEVWSDAPSPAASGGGGRLRNLRPRQHRLDFSQLQPDAEAPRTWRRSS